MSVRLTSSGLQGDYGRPVYTIYFNGNAQTTGTNYPIGSVVYIGGYWASYELAQPQLPDTIYLSGSWNGMLINSNDSGTDTRTSRLSAVSSIRVKGLMSGSSYAVLTLIQRIS